ncbi:TPA: hypothetical protein U1D11_000678 [Streptococcus suis]|nr:hypothetical protein [Streptococcus suis]
MKEIFERIAKSLECIAEELKAQSAERSELRQQFDTLENMLIELRNDPFGIKEKE